MRRFDQNDGKSPKHNASAIRIILCITKTLPAAGGDLQEGISRSLINPISIENPLLCLAEAKVEASVGCRHI